jgi:hypothetical protein
VEEHNYWMPLEKVIYLYAALNQPAAHILYGVSTGAMNEDVTEVLQNYQLPPPGSSVPPSTEEKGPAHQGIPAGVCHHH